MNNNINLSNDLNNLYKKVYLVGAGPGDINLLTLKAVKIIKKADVVVYDRLISQDIMNLIPENARKINVGKNVNNHIVPQNQINQILVEEGKKNICVVRLKGGDPFVFGRGGEEIDELNKNSIPFEVIPGITSSIAAATYGGIPVTHREYASSFHVITGHFKKGSDKTMDYKALVQLKGTLIFMMSVENIKSISEGLIGCGMEKDMPCAIVENGTNKHQRKFISDLSNVYKMQIEKNIVSPAVFIVGKVCLLSEVYDWFSNLPLKDKNIIVTTNTEEKSEIYNTLSDLGANTLLYPCFKTIPLSLNQDYYKINDFSTIIFTSAVGVEVYLNNLINNNIDIRILYNKKIICVGNKTAQKLKQYGLIADFIPKAFNGESLALEAIENNIINKQDNILLLRANNGNEHILKVLEKNNIKYTQKIIYDIQKNNIDENNQNYEKYDYVIFTCKAAIDGFVNSINKFPSALCIGEKTAEYAKEKGFNVYTSKEKSKESLIELVLELSMN